ncbi:2-oxoglutarate dehydrogenase, E2 component, dihydrolipoamide succinyltransferase [Luteipulveratus halotolerans]|uniref:Dihydrolipoamide acetyltransferase component of pyruvate dehydrogenase complex n=1 Tax=Luteipulveratus halotolerans TaxID=1631356 RepID=A0A0L6CGI5_9MICO|nr:2-oxoglutarate dehydrogenase, E2 component, dihydrolipoamide succinyltransferase [Luteipulveratus halotolerans]KNX36917.1 dihydrolipoamide acetyltransferase [Luteipulveratus halotolerans]
MSERVTMPALGESVTEGTVTRWLKNVGDQVAVDEPLLEVSTDKVDTEIPSPVAGTLQEVLVEEDETVPVGADLAVIGDGAAPAGGGDAPEQAAPAAEADKPAAEDKPAESAPAADDKPAESAPAAEATPAEPAPAEQPAASGGGEVTGGETITMPALGESVTEGTITRWLKAEGDDVAVDEPLLEVSTDKVDTEVPSPSAGKLTKILVQEDETVPVGADLAVIGGDASGSASAAPEKPAPAPADDKPAEQQPAEQPAAAAPAAPAEAPSTEQPAPAAEPKPDAPEQDRSQEPASEGAPQQPAAAQPPTQQAAAPAGSSAPASGSASEDRDPAAYVTPLVRKLASEKNVDLASVTGTGVGGRIRKQDVLAAAEAAAAPAQQESAPAAAAPAAGGAQAKAVAPVSPKRGTTEKMSRMRKLIATRMVESLQVSAQLTQVIEVDVTKVARLRAKTKADFEQREGVKLSFLPFFALATVEALKAYPQMNASVEGDSIVYHGSENLGIAVDTEKGLFVPVVKDAGDLNIAGLARKIADLAGRTRDSKVKPDELGGGTFTLTNTGSVGALFDTPIINQPQVGILGTGIVVKRPVVVTDADGGETIAIRSMVYLALSYDHRIIDGADAARFLQAIKARLEEGAFEV